MSSNAILIVDDDPQIRRVLRATLSAQGYEVSEVRTGREAIERLGEGKFNLVLLDMNLPELNGIETCRALRQGGATADVPIIMLTVRNAEKDKVVALDAGADDYVTKPFSTPELLARIRAALRRVPTADLLSECLTFGPAEVDFSARRVRRAGKEYRLTPKEFDLLIYLAARPNRVITHRELLQAVWGPEYGGELEYLRVFVNQLRKKLELNPSNPQYLLTEPWTGYRLHLPERAQRHA